MDKETVDLYRGGMVVSLLVLLLAATIPHLAAQARGPMEIALRTWIAQPTPEKGLGPAPSGRAKHIAIAYNPANQRTYWLGGDYMGLEGGESGRNELWSYEANSGTWTLETPYCSGDAQPSGPDQVGWVFDTNRGLFWMIPGYMWDHTSRCPTAVYNRFMSFEPASRTWSIADRLEFGTPGQHTHAAFDPVTDAIYQFSQATSIYVYDIKSDSRVEVKFQMGRTVRLSRVYHAADIQGRRIYAIDIESAYKGLYAYDLDRKTLADLGSAPVQTDAIKASAVWDSVNKALFCVQAYGPEARVRLDVYDPTTGAWQTMPMIQPEGIAVKGLNSIFDPSQNVLIVGGTNQEFPVPYFFLYRYGNGSGNAQPPAPPKGVRIVK